MADIQKNYFDPQVLSSIANLELLAKMVVEGYLIGLHKSPYHGFSVEFSQHRQYQQGDSLRYIDWKVLARTDRYFIKQFEEETNVRCYILVDVSSSMNYKSNGISKFNYAAYLAASLSYLLLKQRDAVGLVLFSDKIDKILPAKSAYNQIKYITSFLNGVTFGKDTKITSSLHYVAEKLKKRSLVILISDLLDEADEIVSGIKHLRFNKHEVLVFNTLDRAERDFNFKGNIQFEDIESNEKIKTDAVFSKEAYREQFRTHFNSLFKKFNELYIDYYSFFTNTPLSIPLKEFLDKRSRLL